MTKSKIIKNIHCKMRSCYLTHKKKKKKKNFFFKKPVKSVASLELEF